MQICFGVDVGGTSIKFGMFDTKGNLLESWQVPTRLGEVLFEDVAEQIIAKTKEKGFTRSDVLGVGIGVPGPVRDSGYVGACVNLDLYNVNVADGLQGFLTDVPVAVTNDANAAALGEMWRGAGEGYNHLMVITLGTGIGGGIVANGKIVNGLRGVAGEVGHVVVNREEPIACNCGSHGCLEQYASATGVVTTMKRTLESHERAGSSMLSGVDQFSAKDVVDAAKAGDEVAMASLDFSMSYLGKMLADLSQVIDPEAFVIGGGLSNAGDFLIEIIDRHYRECSVFAKPEAKVVQAKLGNAAGIYGAAKLILDKQSSKQVLGVK